MSELLVIADIAGKRVAMPAHEVHSVVEIDRIVPIPRAPEHIVGLSALRSKPLTVIDCALSLGLAREHKADTKAGRKVIVVMRDEFLYGLLVDGVDDVTSARSAAMELSGRVSSAWEQVARGMVETDEGLVILIDPNGLIDGPRDLAA